MAKEAAEKTNKAVTDEQGDMENLEGYINNILNSDTQAPTTIQEAIAGGRNFAQNENKEITDGSKNMWLPKGYIVVDPTKEGNENISYKENNNPKIDEGIVITDAVDENGKSTGNEFVWVPVEDPTTMYGTDQNGNKLGKTYLYNVAENGSITRLNSNWTEIDKDGDKVMGWDDPSNTWEPAILDNILYDANQTYLDQVVEDKYKIAGIATKEGFENQLQKEFEAMIDSVIKYKGFYIGRYESSGLEDNKIPIVQQNQTPTGSTNWYTMYKNSKKLAQADSKVTSSMIYGSQWDQVMLWMKDVENPTVTEEKKYYIWYSIGMGWYSDNVDGNSEHKTGVDLTDDALNRVKNIYDMAGNLYEWTQTGLANDRRGHRGGCYVNPGDFRSACKPDIQYPDWVNGPNLGTRATLYID